VKRLFIVLLCAVGGYLVFAAAGYFLVGQFSSNTHDRSVEAAMTGAFFFGPIGALATAAVGFIRSGRSDTLRPTRPRRALWP
jgi:Na+/proline symporter